VSRSIREAAAVIAVREGDGRPEVLVLERSAGSRFLPGYVAFPGGAMDEADMANAARWFGTPQEAARACAVRELAEEVRLALTAGGLGRGAIAEVESSPPGSAQLREIAHWIAPEDVPVRFDARYYAVVAPQGVLPEADGHEAAHAWWATPADLLEDWASERRKLYWPTFYTMRSLAACSSVADLLALEISTREPDENELRHLPRPTFWQD
jgi:8-oxo-dGTP pyrophosphatase MutT (NUDIX family)